MLHTGLSRSSFVPDNLQILASMAMTMIMPTGKFFGRHCFLSDFGPKVRRLAALRPPALARFLFLCPQKFGKQNFSIYSARWTVRVLVTCISTLSPLRFVPFDGPKNRRRKSAQALGFGSLFDFGEEIRAICPDAAFVTCITMKKPAGKFRLPTCNSNTLECFVFLFLKCTLSLTGLILYKN